jgi:hypothetical protein
MTSCRCIDALKAADPKLQVDSVVLPDGEEYKNMETLGKVWDKALEARLDRGSTFLALGGGVIGDMTGFAAAAYQRGVHFVQVRSSSRLAVCGCSCRSIWQQHHPAAVGCGALLVSQQCRSCMEEQSLTVEDTIAWAAKDVGHHGRQAGFAALLLAMIRT